MIDEVFCNGYQSWSESRHFSTKERIPLPRTGANWLVRPYGDYGFLPPDNELHSWSYTYTPIEQDRVHFLGSLDEFSAFTCFCWKRDKLHAWRDIPTIELNPETPLTVFDLFLSGGPLSSVFEQYFSLMRRGKYFSAEKSGHLKLPEFDNHKAAKCGWTSWYSEYNKISEEVLIRRLNSFLKKEIPLDYFQIDDGYQTAIGDWLELKESFPNGLEPIAQAVKEGGISPGIWIAPFVCEKKSKLFRDHPEWILRDRKGKPVKAGFTPLWSGTFYALDSEHDGLRDYLRKVFSTFLDWGFELFKIDFLYASAIEHRSGIELDDGAVGLTRAAVMRSAIEFIRECLGEAKILACGVPLASAFGLVDYCRIGADIHMKWEHGLLKFARNRERVSTRLALTNSISRFPLNGLAFFNDPDVFIIRGERNKLSEEERFTILLVNLIFGRLLFNSDDPERYAETELKLLKSIFPLPFIEVRNSSQSGLAWELDLKIGGRDYRALINLSDKTRKQVLPKGPLFDCKNRSWEMNKTQIELKPHQSKLYLISLEETPDRELSEHLFAGLSQE